MSKPYREYTEQDIYNLKKENEALKTQIETYAKVNEEDTKEWLKCKHALDEIEEIIKEDCLNCSKTASCDLDTKNCSDLKIDMIKQKIKEVKGNG